MKIHNENCLGSWGYDVDCDCLKKCCICGNQIEAKGTWKEGNNALPVKDGRCCDRCNYAVVIPARLKGLRCK